MTKKISLIVLFLIFLAGLSLHSLWAQKEQLTLPDTQQLQRIESKLEELTAISRTQKELDKKLDHILANQDKIIAELGIIKVRSSLR